MPTAWIIGDAEQMIRVGYVNHRGEAGKRWIIPLRMEFRVSQWHGESPVWLMIAIDCNKGEVRELYMKNIEFNPGE